MIAVVTAHAAYAYVSCRLAGLPWAVSDLQRSFLFDVICWSSISWAMPAFFTLGGFAAASIWSSRGPRGYVRDRLRRIVAPALIAVPVVLLPSLIVWVSGWYVSGRAKLRQVYALVFVDPELRNNYIGPAHLWFLEFLILMLGAYAVARTLNKREPRKLSTVAFRWYGPILLAIPTMFILWAGHWRNRLDPIVDMRNSFVPNPLRWLHHGWFFLVGTWMYGAREHLNRLKPYWPFFVSAAVLIFAVRASLLRTDASTTLGGIEAWILVGSAALFGWFSLFGLIGLSLCTCPRASTAVRYLSDSSYWIYLTHFPVVGLIQVLLYPLAWPAMVKFTISLVLTFAIGVLSYQGVVRYSMIGRGLHGPRERRVAATVRT